MNRAITREPRVLAYIFLAALAVTLAAPASGAQSVVLPRLASEALNQIYSGNPDAAIPLAQALQREGEDDPLGYLIEGEARWTSLYCASCEIKWGMVDAWKRDKNTIAADSESADSAYLAVADKAIVLAEKRISSSHAAIDHLYAGMGYALKARLYGLHAEGRLVARAGVSARQEFMKALEIDPRMADAQAGLGLYNYYVDSLSTYVKVLRFFMGIPAGNKQLGIQQLEAGARDGVLLKVTARFHLAKNLRNFDLDYARAERILAPLVEQYPHNPTFLLLYANLNLELGRTAVARKFLRDANSLSLANPDCAARTRQIASEFLRTID
jgi:hypothetical protein